MTTGTILLSAGILLFAATLIGTLIYIIGGSIGRKKLDKYLKEQY